MWCQIALWAERVSDQVHVNSMSNAARRLVPDHELIIELPNSQSFGLNRRQGRVILHLHELAAVPCLRAPETVDAFLGLLTAAHARAAAPGQIWKTCKSSIARCLSAKIEIAVYDLALLLQNLPFYRIFVADSRAPRDGRHIEIVGHYDPVPGTDAVARAISDRVKICQT